jgi:hypothetical protein
MRVEEIKVDTATAASIDGLVVTQDVPRPRGAKGYAFRKGQTLTTADLPTLQQLDRPVIHVLRLDSGDVGEDEAGQRLARSVAGPGIALKSSGQSRINLLANHRGLLKIDVATLTAINAIDGMALFTLFDDQPVDEREIVAGAKIAPLAIDGASLAEAERLAQAAPEAVVRVLPFEPVQVAVLYREKLVESARERFAEAVRRKAEWFGSSVMTITPVSDEPAAIAATLEDFVRQGAGLIFTAGGSSTDPLDPTILALQQAGAQLVRRGVPVHPGSMFWMAYLRDVPVLSLAACSLFSQATIVDVVLPHVLAGREITAADLAALGHGGLMERGPVYRFPPYARET